jgi:N,N'-diacetyllegionaminate synthase
MKTIIIAEAGVNHNGSLRLAYRLVDAAKKAKANYIKFQLFKHNELTTAYAPQANYQFKNTKKKQTQLELLKKLELSLDILKKIKSYCKKRKINFLLSVFGVEELKTLKKLNLKFIKIPSGEINNVNLLRCIARMNKKIILSTGMASLKEVGFAIKVLKKNGLDRKKISILQCTTDYPTQLKDVNLKSMVTMKEKFKVDVGLSDHTTGDEASMSAVSLGAKIIEKHITLDNNMRGPDHKASLNPKKFKELVAKIKNVEILLGSYSKKPNKSELKNKKIVRKSIVAKSNIKKGEIFSNTNIACKRPEGGISPIYWDKIIGKKAKKNFKEDENIKI